MLEIVRNLINNLGYVVLIAFSVTSFGLFKRLVMNEEPNLVQKILLTLLFGGFGIISTYFGVRVNGAIANTRIIGVMAGGMLCGPFVGLGSAIIAGGHRFLIDVGGITTIPCTITTLLAGVSSAFIYKKSKKENYWLYGLVAGLILESLEMILILTLSRPYEQALSIVKSIFLPMSFTNAAGIAILILIIQNAFHEKELIAAKQSRRALDIARMFSAGIPGLTPPPTERIIGCPAALRSTSRVSCSTCPGLPRTPVSSGGTLPISVMRPASRAQASPMSVCLPQFNASKPVSGNRSRQASTPASLW